jgi:hypothetical protein
LGFFSIGLEDDKELRIDNQYYLRNNKINVDYDVLTDIFLKTKEVLNNLNSRLEKEIKTLI